jgi:hypothetical protein
MGPDSGGSKHLLNVGLLQLDYAVLYLRKLSSSLSVLFDVRNTFLCSY